MTSLRRSTLVVAVALTAALCVGGVALAQTIGRNGKAVTAVRTVVSDQIWQTTSQNFVDIPDMKTFVSVPNDTKALLVITFSVSSACDPDGATAACTVRVTLDGQQVTPVAWWDQGFVGQDSALSARSFQWVAGPVNPGEHQVKVQASVNVTGNFYMSGMTLTVLRSEL